MLKTPILTMTTCKNTANGYDTKNSRVREKRRYIRRETETLSKSSIVTRENDEELTYRRKRNRKVHWDNQDSSKSSLAVEIKSKRRYFWERLDRCQKTISARQTRKLIG